MAENTAKPGGSYSTAHDKSRHEHGEDPLVELARIVSDDGSFFQKAPEKPADLTKSVAGADSFSADLEAELMEQFETSFVRQATGAVDSVTAEMPAQDVYGESRHTAYSESDSRALGAMAAGAAGRSEEAISASNDDAKAYEGAYELAATDDRFAPAGSPADASHQAGDIAPGEPYSDPLPDYSDNPASETATEPVNDPYRVVSAEDPYRIVSAEEVATAAGEPLPNTFEMEFAEALADTASPPLTEDFTPEFGVEAYGRDPEFQGDRVSGDESGHAVSHYDDMATEGEADESFESAVAMPPHDPVQRGGRKGLIAVIGVLAVVVLGGGVVAYMGILSPTTDPVTPAPVIKAESGDVKVMADAKDTAGTAPSVLDQLAGQQGKSEEKLIDRIEEPQQIARVVLPGPDRENTTQLAKPVGGQAEESSGSVTDAIAKTIDRVMVEPQQPTAEPKFDAIGPRKVRTVVVKPDGSFVSNDAAPSPTQLTLPAQPSLPPLETMEVATVKSTPSPEPTPVKTMEITSVPAPSETGAVSGSGASTDGQASVVQPAQVANTQPLASTMDANDAMQATAAPTGLVPRPRPANVPDVAVV